MDQDHWEVLCSFVTLTHNDHAEWLRMRSALWPRLLRSMIIAPRWRSSWPIKKLFAVFVADRGNGQLGGFLEASLRRYADGCSTSPVGYIEGWYVDDDVRRQGGVANW